MIEIICKFSLSANWSMPRFLLISQLLPRPILPSRIFFLQQSTNFAQSCACSTRPTDKGRRQRILNRWARWTCWKMQFKDRNLHSDRFSTLWLENGNISKFESLKRDFLKSNSKFCFLKINCLTFYIFSSSNTI